MSSNSGSFIGMICPYCSAELTTADEIVVCSLCGIPHHRKCWEDNKGCAAYGCANNPHRAGQYTGQPDASRFSGIYCPQCGARNGADNRYCVKCGNRLGRPAGSRQQETDQDPAYTYRQNNPYSQGPYSPYPNRPYRQEDAAGCDEASLIRDNVPYYIAKFNSIRLTQSHYGWNWAAFFFGAYWFFYRKMYKIGVIFSVVLILCSFFGQFSFLFGLAVSIVSGIMGNYYYMRYIEEQLNIIRSLNDNLKHQYVLKQAGTSLGAVLIALGCIVVFNIMLASLSDLRWPYY
jgi:hypothetical protein